MRLRLGLHCELIGLGGCTDAGGTVGVCIGGRCIRLGHTESGDRVWVGLSYEKLCEGFMVL